MKEYIEREALKHELAPYEENDFSQQMDVILAIVDAQPTADVVEVRHGRWNVVEALSDDIQTAGECNICGENINWFGKLPNYCPNCGARMDKEDEHEAD